MKFYKNLYVAKSCIEKEKEICRKLKRSAGQISIFVIVLASGKDLLEIYHCAFLKQKYFKKKDLFVVGIAGSYNEALEVTQDILLHVYQATGDFQVKEFIANNCV